MDADKLIITVAPTGSYPSRELTPYVPLTPEEIAKEVYKSYEAGAAIAHVHVRDSEGKPSNSVKLFKEVYDRIREKCDIIIQFSSSSGAPLTGASDEARLAPIIKVKPEMASLNVASMNFGDRVFLNPPAMVERFARAMLEAGVKPEVECYDMGHIGIAVKLIRKGLLKPPFRFSLVLGVEGGIPPTLKNLLHMVEALPENCNWQVIGIGRYQFPLSTVAMILGGHVRVGMEDNIYLAKGILAKSNAELVVKAIRIAKELGREVATPSDARRMLGLRG
ncbi:MAG: 3-keto-5-aminohexanoate cleavage protein [Candidatus Nezhaarchaeales archaeon]